MKGTRFQSRRLRTSGEGLDRRRGCRGRPSLGDHPAMTRVSELSLRRGRSGTSCEDGARKGFAPSAAGAATSTRGAPPVRCGRRPLIRSAARPAGCWVPRTRNRRLARLRKRSRRIVRDAVRREARGRDFAEIGGTCCASRVGDTAEALFVLRCERPRGRNALRRADRVAGAREKRRSEKVPRAEAKPRDRSCGLAEQA